MKNVPQKPDYASEKHLGFCNKPRNVRLLTYKFAKQSQCRNKDMGLVSAIV